MILFVYGSDSYQITQKKKQLVDAFRAKFDPSGFNISTFQVKASLGDVSSALMSGGFLSEKRMVVLDAVFEGMKKEELQKWTVMLSKAPKDVILVIVECVDKKTFEKLSFVEEMKKCDQEVHAYIFESLDSPTFIKWMTGRAKELSLKINGDLVGLFVQRVGSDLWQADALLQQLFAYAQGKEVTREMIDLIVEPRADDAMFALMDAVCASQSSKNVQTALNLLSNQRKSGSADHQLLAMLARQLRLLIGARSLLDEDERVSKDVVAKKLDVHPYVAQKSLAQAKQFSLDRLINLHRLLQDVDAGSKTGLNDAAFAVDRVVAGLLVGSDPNKK